ncbi:MAG: peptide deformylase, partial [Candidatus Dadabacteria bacterium]|nr:peptide deformylase [Candidatus Dadabacteria bacterium]NIQ15082.1 peptide deformylase [Candidatus Dadabacteria bacterium]
MHSNSNPRYPDAPEMEPIAIINPEITSVSDEIEIDWEGCLSIPGLRGLVPRHKSIEVNYINRKGKEVKEVFEDFPARIFQHEY